jgi:hypothetical protein
MIAAKIVDTHALLNVIWISFALGVGGTAAYSLAIVGATRFAELRRTGHALEAGVFAALTLGAAAACAGAIVLGIVAIVGK